VLILGEEKVSPSGELFDEGSSLRRDRQSGSIDEGKGCLSAGWMMVVSCHQRVHQIINIAFIGIHFNLIRAKSTGLGMGNDMECMNIKKNKVDVY